MTEDLTTTVVTTYLKQLRSLAWHTIVSCWLAKRNSAG